MNAKRAMILGMLYYLYVQSISLVIIGFVLSNIGASLYGIGAGLLQLIGIGLFTIGLIAIAVMTLGLIWDDLGKNQRY